MKNADSVTASKLTVEQLSELSYCLITGGGKVDTKRVCRTAKALLEYWEPLEADTDMKIEYRNILSILELDPLGVLDFYTNVFIRLIRKYPI